MQLDSAECDAEAWARAKARHSPSATVDLKRVADEVGATIIGRRYRDHAKPQGSLERARTGRWNIIVPAAWLDDPISSRRARFTIAHELAHILLQERGVPIPTSRRSYWRLETVCNKIAGALLVPSWIVLQRPVRLSSSLASVDRVRHKCNVSYDVAAVQTVEAPNNVVGAATIRVDSESGAFLTFSSGMFPAPRSKVRDPHLSLLVQRSARNPGRHVHGNLISGSDELGVALCASRSDGGPAYVHVLALTKLPSCGTQISMERAKRVENASSVSLLSEVKAYDATSQLSLFGEACES